jgi:hypothetical protein
MKFNRFHQLKMINYLVVIKHQSHNKIKFKIIKISIILMKKFKIKHQIPHKIFKLIIKKMIILNKKIVI